MEPWQSWAIALAGGGAAYWYYTNKTQAATKNKPQVAAEPVQAQAKASKKRDDKARRKPASASTPEPSSSDAATARPEQAKAGAAPGDASKKRKAGKKTETPAPAAPAVTVQREEPAEDSDNKAWAQQMASVRKGTNLAPPAGSDVRNRATKGSAATSSSAISPASSTNGADADDDLSPAMSPSMTAGDVSDMLEKPAPGPSVLRLTSSGDSAPRQPRAAKEFQPAETKRQRQNRKKQDDAKVEREAAERERQANLERQRRTAREARGEPARNGVPVSKPPAVSAWAASSAARATQAPVSSVSGQDAPLLDTFDHDAESNSSSAGALNNSTAATSTASNVPSEVGQQVQDETNWNTVGKKKQKKYTVDREDAASPPAATERENAPNTTPAPRLASSNGFAHLAHSSKFDAGSHPDDSSWGA